MAEDELAQYAIGVCFSWLQFVSSSPEREQAEKFAGTAMFVLDNAGPSAWKPREVTAFNAFGEVEAVHPIGAEFVVTDVVENAEVGYIELYCSLLDPTED